MAVGCQVKKKLPAALGEIFLLKVDEEETHNFTSQKSISEITQKNIYIYKYIYIYIYVCYNFCSRLGWHAENCFIQVNDGGGRGKW